MQRLVSDRAVQKLSATRRVPIEEATRFCDGLAGDRGVQDRQVRQAEQALRICFVNFLKESDWYRRPAGAMVDAEGAVDPLAALKELRRHYARRTEHSYADWVRRFLAYVSERQGDGPPRVDPDAVRDFLTYLAVRRRVAASTQNQALCAVLFLCREVLGVDVDQDNRQSGTRSSWHGVPKPKCARSGVAARRYAENELAAGGAHLRWRASGDRMLLLAREGHRLRSGIAICPQGTAQPCQGAGTTCCPKRSGGEAFAPRA